MIKAVKKKWSINRSDHLVVFVIIQLTNRKESYHERHIRVENLNKETSKESDPKSFFHSGEREGIMLELDQRSWENNMMNCLLESWRLQTIEVEEKLLVILS